MKKYTFINNITWADFAFEAKGKTLEELFSNATEALTSIMVDLKTLKAIKKKTFTLNEKTPEAMLYLFLEKIIFLKDAEQFLAKKINVKIYSKKIIATLYGETINNKTMKLGTDVKGITLHKYKLEKTPTEWKTRVVADV